MGIMEKKMAATIGFSVQGLWSKLITAGDLIYLEVHGTYNLPSYCRYNPNISPITTVTLDIIGL